MNQSDLESADEYTLDPPGTVVVVGAGLLGVEAGLYARFLGYNVQILEQQEVGSAFRARSTEDLPMMPNRCLSPLASSALQAQSGEALPPVPPLNFGEWVDQILVPITETDLLRGRVHTQVKVTEIHQIPAVSDDSEASDEAGGDVDNDEAIPPDFQLQGQSADGTIQTFDAEAVILAVGRAESEIQLGFPRTTPYFFSIGGSDTGDWEADLRAGWKEITQIFAELGGRADLDLYRPRRM